MNRSVPKSIQRAEYCKKLVEGAVVISAVFFIFIHPAQSQITLAIADFTNRTERIYLDSWEQKIPEFLHSELSQSNDIILVERQSLRAILDEQALSMSGLIDSSAQEVGKLLSAKYMITGSINEVGKWFRIDARIINVKTGKVVGEKVQSKHSDQIDKMIWLLASNLRYQLTGKGEYQAKISLNKYPTTAFLLGTLSSGLVTMLVHNQYIQKRGDYHDTINLQSFNTTYDSANRLFRTRNLFLSVTGIGLAGTLYCWFRNLSPDDILAAHPAVCPYMMSTGKGELRVGFCVTF